jgi:hypothetical protein
MTAMVDRLEQWAAADGVVLRPHRDIHHDQLFGQPRVDRHHRGADTKAGNGQADKRGQRQRVVVEVLWQPQLSHAGLVGGTVETM